MPEGTFLVRDSTHPSYLFTLSVKTNRGPTNVRIEYTDSKFRLDSNYLSKPRILAFPDVVSLIQHYVMSCTMESKNEAPYPPPSPLPPMQKEMAAAAVHLKLIRPLSRKDNIPSLQHLCRLQINKSTADVDQLPLPRRMGEYLKQYPFQLWSMAITSQAWQTGTEIRELCVFVPLKRGIRRAQWRPDYQQRLHPSFLSPSL